MLVVVTRKSMMPFDLVEYMASDGMKLKKRTSLFPIIGMGYGDLS